MRHHLVTLCHSVTTVRKIGFAQVVQDGHAKPTADSSPCCKYAVVDPPARHVVLVKFPILLCCCQSQQAACYKGLAALCSQLAGLLMHTYCPPNPSGIKEYLASENRHAYVFADDWRWAQAAA